MPYILTIKLRDFGRGCVNDIGTRQRNKMVLVPTQSNILYKSYIFSTEKYFTYTHTRILNNIKIKVSNNMHRK